MTTLLSIIIATLLISMGSLIGIVTLFMKQKQLSKILLFLISLSTGALMGGAFLHLLPEAAEELEASTMYIIVLISFVTFFFVEKLLHWRHCHKGTCDVHSFGYMNLFGDSIHNFLDGLILAAAFITDIKLGTATTIAIALHEVPQEISDYGVLLHAGFDRTKALVANFLVALTVVAGGIVGYYLSNYTDNLTPYLLPFAAGGFIYIAASDLMPEIRKEQNLKKSMVSFGVFILGILFMYAVRE